MNSNIKVIIADDHEMLRKGFFVLLRKQPDIEIIAEAENGKDLLLKVQELKPDVVISDIQMPVMDGIEATKKMSSEYPEINVIALTMFNEDKLILDMLEAGAKGYLLKNTNQEELSEAIKAVYNGGTYFCTSTSDKLKRLIGQSSFNPYKTITRSAFTSREIEIMQWICAELQNKEIAEKLNLSVRTIESYRERIFEKTESKTVAGITIFAVKHGYYKI